MKNDLLEIIKRSHEIVSILQGGIPLSMYDAEMEVLNILTDELLVSMGYETNYSMDESNQKRINDLKNALRNMYFLGQVTERFNTKTKE